MAGSKLIVKDKGWKKLKKTLGFGAGGQMYTFVGVHDPSIAWYVYLSEYGGIADGNDIPPRPAMHRAYDQNVASYKKELNSIVSQALQGVKPRVVLDRVGKKAVQDIRKQIDTSSSWADGLRKMTLALRRGRGVFHEQPLLDSEKYYNSLKHIIRKRKRKGDK